MRSPWIANYTLLLMLGIGTSGNGNAQTFTTIDCPAAASTTCMRAYGSIMSGYDVDQFGTFQGSRCLSPDSSLGQGTAADKNSKLELELQTVDHFVPHISTIPANAGEEVELFVRERFLSGDEKNNADENAKFFKDKCRRKGPAVLLIHGRGFSSISDFDVDFEDYSWMSYLAENCFDVFAVDLQGYGLSPRPKPMEDPCNASTADQNNFLIPNPLPATCLASYSQPVESIQASSDEIDTVVDYIRELRKDKKLKINLIGWSRGGTRVIKYTADHSDKVEKVFLFGPGRLPPAPAATVSLQVLDRAHTFAGWDNELDQKNCPNTFDPAIRDTIWNQLMAEDDLGRTWGESGLMRVPGLDRFGWDDSLPSQITQPTMIVRGTLDTIADAPAIQKLYGDLGSTDKVLLTVSCATHYLPYEKRHAILLDASLQWLSSGTYDGNSSGTFVK